MKSRDDASEWGGAARFGRRTFVGGAGLIGAAAAMPVLAKPARAATRRGGHLVLGLNGAAVSDSLNPARFTATFMQVFGSQFYDTLTEVDVHDRVVPALAESWDVKPGAREWVFKIRQGVTFSNGKSLTAADVVYTLNYHRAPQSTSPAKALLAPVVDLKATGPHEVTILLSGGNADLSYAVGDYHLCIGPVGTKFTDAIGTGAFILESFQPGVRGQARRNPHYWRDDRGFVDSTETLAINDDTARISALVSGSVHLINSVPPKSVALLKASRRVQLFEIASGGQYTFPMRCNTAPYDNNDVRLALKYAIDRQAILDHVLLGHGTIGNDQPVPHFDRFYAADIPQHRFDPDKAKFHLKKSGYDGEFELNVSPGTFTGAVDTAEIFQASAAKAGVKLSVKRVPSDGYWDNVWMKVPFCASYWDGRPTADEIFSVVYASNAPWNESAWKSPAFDKLLVAARAELDVAKRKQMYREMQLLVHDDGGEIIPLFNNTIDAGSAKVRGFVQLPILQMAGFRAPQTVWLES